MDEAAEPKWGELANHNLLLGGMDSTPIKILEGYVIHHPQNRDPKAKEYSEPTGRFRVAEELDLGVGYSIEPDGIVIPAGGLIPESDGWYRF